MKRKVLVIVLALLVVLISMSLFACKPEDELLTTNGQVPVYQGMIISSDGNIINNMSSRMAPSENSSDVAQYIHGDHTGRDEDVDQETPFDNVPTIEEKTESTLVVNGSGAEIYYSSKNQDIYITIKVLNPDSYEIVSFTLNGNKYTSYMFEAGSDLENLILKLNVGDAAGIVDYTIDAIKYIDGTEIKDVLIEGEKTVKAGVRADDQTYVNVTNNASTLNTISFNATLVDLYDLIAKSNGYAKAVLYDGVSVVSTKDLTAGENSIVFDSLVPNKLYQYGITVLYDNLSGDGIQLNTIYTYATYTKTIVLFDNMSVSQTDISFDYLWEETFENKTITNLALYRGGEEVKALSSTALLISNLLSNVEYEIRASYLNLNQESETISVFFTTVSKATPVISIITPDSTQTDLSYEITETDTDAVGAITKIELLHGTDTPVEAANIETRTFAGLLSNNAYTVKVTYTYNLNDGTGDKIITREQEITTVSKATPAISIITPDSTQTDLSYEITETDTDAVGAITKIELLHGTDTPVEAANIETRTFAGLLSNNAYTVKVTYTYNLNDGTGDKIITREQEITTVSKATPAISIITPDSTQTDLSYEITETDTDAVGAITKIELLHGADAPVEAANIETRTFTGLLSNNAYTVKVTYTYNLNDGTGDKIITREQEITTVSKATPAISIINPNSTQTALSYEITETDTDAVGAITKIELLHGADAPVEAATLETRTFTELLSNNAYTVKVTYTYNLNDGTGDKIITREQEITTVSKATPAISIITPDSTQTALSYEITETDTDAVGAITKIELLHGTDTPVEAANIETRTFAGLLSNNAYTVKVTYTYNLNDGTGDKVISREQEITTVSKATPAISIINPNSTQTALSYEITETDTDAVGAITKIELLHGADAPVEAATLETRTFTELLSNNAYTVKVTYTYNLNDGTGDKIITREQEITTVSKATPAISIINPNSTQTALSYEITETDTDAVGAITKIELLHGADAPVEAANIETRTFAGLLSNNAYTVKVTYTYNLNDGVGNQAKTANLLIWTAPTLSFTQASCANTGPVSKGETIYFEASVNNPNNVSFTKVKINGQYYNVSSGTSYTEIIVNMTVEEQFEGGNTDLTVTEIVGTLNGFERKIDVSENNTASVFVNGELNVLSIKIVDENGREGEVSYQSEGNYYIVELANRTGYVIESITINGRENSYPYTIDQNTLKIRADLSLGYNNAEVTSITYSNESVGQKTKAIEGISINSIICLTNPTPIVISNATDLKNMDDWGYYVLENDIDLLGTVENEWLNPGYFRGLFDGQGHKIVNMKFAGTIENENLTWGLFSNASGIIRNVIVSGRLLVTITGGSAYTGGVAVGVDNVLSMNNVGNDVNISINNQSANRMSGTVDNSFWRIGNIYYAKVNGIKYERNTLQGVIDLLEPVWDETVWNFGEPGLPVAKERYTITYNNLEGAQNNLDNLLIYTTRNEEIALLAPKKIGSIFLGWYEDELMNGSAVTDIPIGEYGDLQYYAKWEVCVLHTLDENCVCTICGAITHNKGIDGRCTVCEQQLYVRDGSYIWFGEYPQTIATSEALAQMGTTADSKGYFTSSYDNERYAKVVATPYSTGYTFSDTSAVTNGNTYFFKVEPIKWRILSESGGNALILCESIIANRRFDDRGDNNNYAASEVRAWLNGQFYNTAFNTVQRALIKTTEGDNSVYSTGYDTNPYVCTNTFDKIFLPSFRDVTNTAYGFNANGSSSDTARKKIASDYTRATGAYVNSGNGYWWLRSAYYDYSTRARYVLYYGVVSNYFHDGSDYVDYTFYGLVPALTISLN